MIKIVGLVKIFTVFLLFSLLYSGISACEPTVEFKIVNETEVNLKIYYGGALQGAVSPGKTLNFEQFANFPVFNITAKDSTGSVVYSANFSRSDVGGKKTFEVVIPPSAK